MCTSWHLRHLRHLLFTTLQLFRIAPQVIINVKMVILLYYLLDAFQVTPHDASITARSDHVFELLLRGMRFLH